MIECGGLSNTVDKIPLQNVVVPFGRFVQWTALFSIRQVGLSIGKLRLVSGTYVRMFFWRASEKVCRFDRFVKWTALFPFDKCSCRSESCISFLVGLRRFYINVCCRASETGCRFDRFVRFVIWTALQCSCRSESYISLVGLKSIYILERGKAYSGTLNRPKSP